MFSLPNVPALAVTCIAMQAAFFVIMDQAVCVYDVYSLYLFMISPQFILESEN